MKKEKLITDPAVTGDRIKRLRNNDYKTRPGKMSQPELAEKIYCSEQTVRRYENGRCGSLDIQTVDLLVKALNTNVGFLIGKISNPDPMDSWESFAELRKAETRLAEREEITDFYRQKLSGMFEYFNYHLELPTLDETYGETLSTQFAGFISKFVPVKIYAYSDPSKEYSLRLKDFRELMDEIGEFLEFRLYKLSKLYLIERETPEKERGDYDE